MASGLQGPEAQVLQTYLLLVLHLHTSQSLLSSVRSLTSCHVQHSLRHALIIDIQRCRSFFRSFAQKY